MRRMIIMEAFALALIFCVPGDSMPLKHFSAVTDTLLEGKHFALADLGKEKALLIRIPVVCNHMVGIADLNAS